MVCGAINDHMHCMHQTQLAICVGFAIRFKIVNEFVEINFSDIP